MASKVAQQYTYVLLRCQISIESIYFTKVTSLTYELVLVFVGELAIGVELALKRVMDGLWRTSLWRVIGYAVVSVLGFCVTRVLLGTELLTHPRQLLCTDG